MLQLAGEQRAKILAGEIFDTERLGKIVAGANGQDGKGGTDRFFLRHQAIDDLVDHAVAAKGDNGTVAWACAASSLACPVRSVSTKSN